MPKAVTFLRRHLLLAMGLVVALPCLSADMQLALYTEEYPPINYSAEGKPSGIGTAIVAEIMRRAGITTTVAVVPWARGYRTVQTTPNTGLFVTSRTPQRETMFHWVGPLVRTQGMLYARRSAQISIGSLADAAKLGQVAVPRDWYLQQLLENAGLKNLYPVVTPVNAFQMLQSGRVSLAAIDDVNLHSTVKELGLDAADFVAVHRVAESLNYLALSPGTPEHVVQAATRAFESMKADGTLSQLYRRWLPGVSPP